MTDKAVKKQFSDSDGSWGLLEERYRRMQDQPAKIMQKFNAGPFLTHFTPTGDKKILTMSQFGRKPENEAEQRGGISLPAVQAQTPFVPALIHSWGPAPSMQGYDVDTADGVDRRYKMTIPGALLERTDECCVLNNVFLQGAPDIEKYEIYIGKTLISTTMWPIRAHSKKQAPICIYGSFVGTGIQPHEVDMTIEVYFDCTRLEGTGLANASTKSAPLLVMIHQLFPNNFDQLRQAVLKKGGFADIRKQLKEAQASREHQNPNEVIDVLDRGLGMKVTTHEAISFTALTEADKVTAFQWTVPPQQNNRVCGGIWLMVKKTVAPQLQSFQLLNSHWLASVAADGRDDRTPTDMDHYFLAWGAGINMLDASNGAITLMQKGDQVKLNLNGALDVDKVIEAGDIQAYAIWVDLYRLYNKKAELLSAGHS